MNNFRLLGLTPLKAKLLLSYLEAYIAVGYFSFKQYSRSWP